MIGTRFETIVNQPVMLGFRHLYAGVLQDASAIVSVKIYNPNGAEVALISGADVQRVDNGCYQVLAPASLFTTPGPYRDVWTVQSTAGSAARAFNFAINVVIVPVQNQTNWASVLACSMDDLNASMMKDVFLWPVWSVLANGYYLPDSIIQFHIDSAITWMQRTLGLPLQRRRVRTRPFAANVGQPLTLGVDYDEEGQLLPWSAVDAGPWSGIRLPHSGISKVWGIRGIYGGRTVYEIPTDWVDRNQVRNGMLYIRPTTVGNIANIVDGDGRFLDVTLLESAGANSVPGFWAVDYDYGPTTPEFAGGIPKEIVNVLMKKAAIDVLDQLGQAISRGVSSRSASVDGLSTSVGTVANAERTMFGALVTSYQRDLDPAELREMRSYYKGPSIFII